MARPAAGVGVTSEVAPEGAGARVEAAASGGSVLTDMGCSYEIWVCWHCTPNVALSVTQAT
ncbi:hypothetical protein GCM10009858_04850 [Terrabacter carboxydivorans]|uniref:Uncharacterized protein n=1 Tax=Terrabacter carboxydivorans TaxID=619730 RepID=A0ABN3KRU7_9MICO